MALLTATRTAQDTLVATFQFNWDDTMVNKAGVLANFTDVAAAQTFVVIPLPPNSIVLSGSVTTNEAWTGVTATNITLGDSLSSNRYMALVGKQTAARTALLQTDFINASGVNIEMVFANTVAPATAGMTTITVEYIVLGRAGEVQVA